MTSLNTDPQPASSGSSDRTARYLRRLRWRLTALFSLTTLAALAILAFVAFRIDDERRWAQMSEALIARAQEAAEAVSVVDGGLDWQRFFEDEGLRQNWPQVWVYEVHDDEVIALAGPDDDWFRVDIEAAVVRVLDTENRGIVDVGTTEWDATVQGRAVLIRDPETTEVAGVALAIVDEDDFFGADARRVRFQVFGAAVFLAAGAAGAGFWLAGRGTRATGEALAQQERLLSAAAHELRTPVAKIRAVAESGLAGDEPAEAALSRVDRLTQDAGQMVDDMLVLARMDAGQELADPEPLRLDLLAEQVANAFPDVKLETVETVVEGDAGLLRRAISNLVRNAVIHGGADVRITVYPSRVVVTDSGPGLEGVDADELFERFRTGPRSPGHGLGLPIVKWIADVHGGTVSLADRNGGGAEAVLEL